MSYDPEGARTVFIVYLDVAAMRASGRAGVTRYFALGGIWMSSTRPAPHFPLGTTQALGRRS